VEEKSQLSDSERQRRSGVFGDVASHYERFRPGPPAAAIKWMLPEHVATVVDLGAGTGAMTKDLLPVATRVIAVEPDDRMRDVLAHSLPSVLALKGFGEAIPLEDASADAVVASASWHWMDADLAVPEVARVLVDGGTLGVVWAGPDPDGPFLAQSRAMLSQMSSRRDVDDPDLGDTVMDSDNRVDSVLRLPLGAPFTTPEHQVLTWDVALTADELIGMLGTFSWILTMEDERRAFVIAEARRLLRDALGVHGDVTVDVQYRSEAWRTKKRGASQP
jgi:SAM-dependent methyltransferase